MLGHSSQQTVHSQHKIARRLAASRVPRPQQGFSLIELLVSMALFLVVVTMGVGALLVLINANVKAQNTQEAVSNIQFALDSMSREIRTGIAYVCSTSSSYDPNLATLTDATRADCASGANKGRYLAIVEGGKSLTGDATSNRRIAYRWNGTAIQRRIEGGIWVNLTNANITITNMHFNVAHTNTKEGTSDTRQPNVTIYVKGFVEGISDTSSEFQLQTTVTQRVLDI